MELQPILSVGNGKGIKLSKAKFAYSGFTLIELLVTLTIISIVATVTFISIPDTQNELLEREAERLLALIRHAEDEAMLQNIELALLTTRSEGLAGYSFLQYDYNSQSWQQPDDPILRPRSIPERISLDLETEHEVAHLVSETDGQLPEVFILSSGVRTAYRLLISNSLSKSATYIIQSNGANNAELYYVREDAE